MSGTILSAGDRASPLMEATLLWTNNSVTKSHVMMNIIKKKIKQVEEIKSKLKVREVGDYYFI